MHDATRGTTSGGDELAVLSRGEVRRLGAGGPRVSVILPVKNRADNLRRLLPRLLAQECDVDLEILAVDSGSDDPTIAVLQAAGATVLTTPPERFSYGLTRNAAARHAGGSILVFVTSTVLPLDTRWLPELLRPFDDPEVAGAFSRSIPRADADALTCRDYLRADLTAYRTAEASAAGPGERRAITDRDRYRRLTPTEHRRFISFSNNAAAIRASVFAQIPFRDHHICEDMLWAQEALEAGHAIVYQRSSLVSYSHAYDAVDFFGRCFDGGVFFSQTGGGAADADVVLNIFRMIRDDWQFLTDGRRMRGEALETHQAASVLRRTAEMLGQWLGTRHRELADLDGLRAALRVLPAAVGDGAQPYGDAALAALERGLADRAGAVEASTIERDLLAAIAARWSVMPAEPSEARIDAAVRMTIDAGFFWLGRCWTRLRDRGPGLSDVFSLIARLRLGGKTFEMREPMTAAPTEPFDPGWQSNVDRGALLQAVEGLQAEYLAAHRELELRAGAMARLHADVVARDTTIRALQAELFAKVGERDRLIRELQEEMHMKVAECRALIAALQARG